MVVAADPGTLGGSALASWTALTVLLSLFAAVVVGLTVAGRPDERWGRLALLSRPPEALERLTGVPGWAATAIGTSLFGLLVAGEGFYSDVSWHIALGRDDELFTAPHTSILLGLVLILGGAVLGTVAATLGRVPGCLRVGALRVPPSLVPLWALGVGAVLGFPADEIWHQAYGVDVTMWSPTHMLMILGATFTPAAVWMVLGATGITPAASRWGRGLHVACAALTVQGLVAPLGEFSFGVPQFSLLFAPVLVTLAGAVAIVATRLVLGPGWAFGIVAVTFALGLGGDDGPVSTRSVGSFLLSAVVVEVAAAVLGTSRLLRLAAVAGIGVGTIGLLGEWWWNQGATQPWTSGLLPEAVVLAAIAGVAGAVLGVALATAIGISGSVPEGGVPGRIVAAAFAASALVIVGLLPRPTGDVRAEVRLEDAAAGTAVVEVTLDPPEAATDAYWLQVTAWQGGGLVVAEMEPTGQAGAYRSDRPVPVDGFWKTLLRLHRDGEMMAVPVYLPADPTIDEPAIPAVDRVAPFESERRYLLRETHDGTAWLAPVVHGFLAAVIAVWAAAFHLAARRRPAPAPSAVMASAAAGPAS